MVKRDGNIDIVFRDGLKSLEVLPPADVWAGISKEINAPLPVRGLAFRVAAGVAALVSLGLLTYFVGITSSQNMLEPLALESSPGENNIIVDNFNNPAPVVAQALPAINNSEATGPVAIPGRDTEENAPAILKYSEMQEDVITAKRENSLDIIIPKPIAANYSPENLIGAGNGDVLSEVELNVNDADRDRWMLGAKLSPTYLSTNLKPEKPEYELIPEICRPSEE